MLLPVLSASRVLLDVYNFNNNTNTLKPHVKEFKLVRKLQVRRRLGQVAIEYVHLIVAPPRVFEQGKLRFFELGQKNKAAQQGIEGRRVLHATRDRRAKSACKPARFFPSGGQKPY